VVTENEHRALDFAARFPSSANHVLRLTDLVGAETAAWAYRVQEARLRAKGRFEKAAEMLFTLEALEQSTHPAVAAWHAAKFPTGEPVSDLTCGIGSDLLALATRGPATGYELDAERARFARHNLRIHELEAEVLEEDGLAHFTSKFALADPGRRSEGRRLADPADYHPDPARVAEAMQNLELGIMKLSPLLSNEVLMQYSNSMEFVSYGRECREVCLSFGRLAQPGIRAVNIESGETLDECEITSHTYTPGTYLYEGDPAAIRAHALGHFGLDQLGDSPGYLTGNQWVHSPWLTAYEVLWSDSLDQRRLKTHLRERKAARPTLKQRGTELDLEALRKQLKPTGAIPTTLAFFREGRRRHVVSIRLIPPKAGNPASQQS